MAYVAFVHCVVGVNFIYIILFNLFPVQGGEKITPMTNMFSTKIIPHIMGDLGGLFSCGGFRFGTVN